MYKINRDNLKKEKKFFSIFFFVGLLFLMLFTLPLVVMLCVFKKIDSVLALSFPFMFVWFIAGVSIKIGFDGMKKINEKNKIYDYLEVHGKLIKGLTYQMMPTGMSVNEKPIYKIVATYEKEDGAIIELEGDGRFDRKNSDEDGLVDLLIDTTNPENYYLDFNIEKSEYQNYNYSNSKYDSYKNYQDKQSDYDPIRQ